MKKELTIPATLDNIAVVTDAVNEFLESCGFPLKAQTQVDIAIDELFGNIAAYAYHPETGTATVLMEKLEGPSRVIITFMDQGVPFDPLEEAEPDTTRSAEEREIGGLGIFLVRKIMNGMDYEYKDGQNILSITKHYESSPDASQP